MRSAAFDTDVLIVGAGPVGLFLANECARRGLRWRLVEARASQSVHSKALAIFPRTLEIFDMAGLVGPFLEVANRVTSVAVVTHGRTLAHMRFAPEESPYPFIAMVPQNVTEQTAGGAAAAPGAEPSSTRRHSFPRFSTTTASRVTLDQQGQRLDADGGVRRRLRRRAQRGPASPEPAIRRSAIRRVVHAGGRRDQRHASRRPAAAVSQRIRPGRHLSR